MKLKKYVSTKEYSFISDLLKSKDLKKRIISFDISSKKNYFNFVKKDSQGADLENLGAKFYDNFKNFKIKDYILIQKQYL